MPGRMEGRDVIPGDEMEMRNGAFEVGDNNNEEMSGRGYNQDKPPEDDCCPICFGEFKVPCRANCGHWFCGSCVLQLWEYRSRPRRCKCPFCSSSISKLTPEASVMKEMESEVAEVLENIQHYNSYYVEGAYGLFLLLSFYFRKHGPLLHLHIWRLFRALVLLVIMSPVFFMRAILGLIRHPGRIRLYLPRVRMIACTLSLLLHLYHGFLPSGYLTLKVAKLRLFIDCVSIILVVCPYALIMCKTWVYIMWLRFRIWKVRREIDALKARDAILREQEVALKERANALRGQVEEDALVHEEDETEAPSQAEARTAIKPETNPNLSANDARAVLQEQDSDAAQEPTNGEQPNEAYNLLEQDSNALNAQVEGILHEMAMEVH